MSEQKLQNFDTQRRTGWYLNRLTALPAMRSHGKFDRVVRTYGYKCAICNTINPSLTVDHKFPKSRGGTSDIGNLRLLCLEDHRLKDNKRKKVKKKQLCRDAMQLFLNKT